MEIEISYAPYQEQIYFNSPAKYNIYPKGRRLGATQGGIQAVIDLLFTTPNYKILWGDTVNANIDRYVERYGYPVLKTLPDNSWKWNQNKKELKINDSICDFRSADRPENWEGFGYNLVILNEAGIILKNPALYTNTILPMMLDFADSKLIAIGTPKGKFIKTGGEHKFYELHKRAIEGDAKYFTKTYSSYDSEFIDDEEIRELENDMHPEEAKQEIYGQFIELVDGIQFMYKFDEKRHVSAEAVYQPNQTLIISFDFNLEPFCAITCHIWRDSTGEHCHTIGELSVTPGNIDEMINRIKIEYPHHYKTKNILITGDASGKRGELSQRDNASHYLQIQRGLQLSNAQIKVPANPRVSYSRGLSNTILNKHTDYKIHPKCKGIIRDMKFVKVDAYGDIIKRNRKDISQQADLIDCIRYRDHTFLNHFIK